MWKVRSKNEGKSAVIVPFSLLLRGCRHQRGEGRREGKRTYLVDHLPLREQHEDVEELEDGVAGLVDGQDDGLPVRGQVGKDLHHLFMGEGAREGGKVEMLLCNLLTIGR